MNKNINKEVEILKKENQLLNNRIESLENKNLSLTEQIKRNEELLAFLPIDNNKTNKQKSNSKLLKYKLVTVLFANVKGFAKLAGLVDSKKLIDELDRFFYQFEMVVKKHNIEKINSIGDTFICAGGFPFSNKTNPIEIILAALEMKNYLRVLQKKSKFVDEKIWELTFGIHTGAVFVGLEGVRKRTFAIKGDTVNITSRIESSSQAGKITISELTYDYVNEYFDCDFAGKIPVKFKSDMKIYRVNKLKKEFSIDDECLIPNDKFNTKFQLTKYEDLNEYVLDKLEKELPDYLQYHNLKHTIDATISIELIASGENISDKELLLLKTAALLHDIGLIYGSENYEEKSVEISKPILKKYRYSENQINEICNIILATKKPTEASSTLEQIMCDADLNYIGRSDFIKYSDMQYWELKTQNLIESYDEWISKQIDLVENYEYYTLTAKNMRQLRKEKQIKKLNEAKSYHINNK